MHGPTPCVAKQPVEDPKWSISMLSIRWFSTLDAIFWTNCNDNKQERRKENDTYVYRYRYRYTLTMDSIATISPG
jgi:hypothetical protein